jgi:hypothetical protein
MNNYNSVHNNNKGSNNKFKWKKLTQLKEYLKIFNLIFLLITNYKLVHCMNWQEFIIVFAFILRIKISKVTICVKLLYKN